MHNLEKREQYINLYFEKFHPCWSFIHKGTFDIRHETPLLVQSMVVIGLWARGEQSAQSAAVELHGKLDSAIRDQRVCGTNLTPQFTRFADVQSIGEMGCL